MTNKAITKNISLKEYNRADNVIRYLLNPDDETVTLTETEKRMYDVYKEIHGYRLRFMNKANVAAVIIRTKGVKERQAYNLINETEKIFGSVQKVHKEYERQFLLTKSLKNIELAFSSRDSNQITKALLAHSKISGLDEFVPDMPDFSKLEAHIYEIKLPDNMVAVLQGIMKAGAIKLTDIIPPPTFDTSGIDQAKEV